MKKRQASTIEELQGFYDVMLPRIDRVMDFVNRFPLQAMPDDAKALLALALSFAEVAPAVEWYRQPSVIRGFDVQRYRLVEDTSGVKL